MDPSAAPQDHHLFVVGIGNPLREDDGVGLYLVERLQAKFGVGFHGVIVYEPDIALAETIASFDTLLVVDALATATEEPFRLLSLAPAVSIYPAGGYSSHVFDWGMILAMARDLFGHAPQAFLCGVRAHSFGISQALSPQCQADAERAFTMLCDFVTTRSLGSGGRNDQLGEEGGSLYPSGTIS